MGIQRMSVNDLFSGVSDCMKNKLGISQQLEFSNGESAAGFHYILYKKPDDLCWSVVIQDQQANFTYQDIIKKL